MCIEIGMQRNWHGSNHSNLRWLYIGDIISRMCIEFHVREVVRHRCSHIYARHLSLCDIHETFGFITTNFMSPYLLKVVAFHTSSFSFNNACMLPCKNPIIFHHHHDVHYIFMCHENTFFGQFARPKIEICKTLLVMTQNLRLH